MEYTKGRYSWVIRPLLIGFDLCVINGFAYSFFNFNQQNLYFFSNELLNNKHFLFLLYSVALWLLSSSVLKFYKVYRYTSPINILTLLIQQFLTFTFIFFAFIGAFRSIDIQIFEAIMFLMVTFLVIGVAKFVSYYLLKFFRKIWRGNLRQIVIIGNSESAQEMHKLATIKKDLGYRIKATFSDYKFKNLKGKPKDCFEYLKTEDGIDEIYCSIDEFSEREINQLVKLAELNHFNLKFLQESKLSITKRLKTDFYNYLPVLSLQEVPINNDLNKIIKRIFDILFSFFVILS